MPDDAVVWPDLSVAVGQTNGLSAFLCVCDNTTNFDRSISIAESPLWPPEPFSRGHPKWLLSNSYSGFALSDSHGDEQEHAATTRQPCFAPRAVCGACSVAGGPATGFIERKPDASSGSSMLYVIR